MKRNENSLINLTEAASNPGKFACEFGNRNPYFGDKKRWGSKCTRYRRRRPRIGCGEGTASGGYSPGKMPMCT